LCPARCLQDLLRKKPGKKLDEEEARQIFKVLISTVAFLHSKNIAHCDLKFENILYDELSEKLKLIDFGFSVEDPENNPPTFLCGTPSYMAPEEVLKKNINLFKADVWSLGVILFKLVTGLFPFRGTPYSCSSD
jgi:serine/threonine protein kinase